MRETFLHSILFLLCFSLGFCQTENSERKIELIPPSSSSLKKLDIGSKNPNYFSIKKNDDRNSSNQTLNQKETFLNPADIYLKKLNREEKKKPNNYNKGEYLGDVSTGSTYVNILCRDFEYVDGDRVRISVNDSIIIYNLFLESKFAGFKLPLTKGFNKVDFTALNQGSSGPNTAELRVFDDSNQLISSNQWNLSTGATATFIVVKK
ncbi:MAG: hypothetical protein L7R87_04595 [Flavobacteriaceae bacterium]|nr:hypothetical protein [Flavobacteriaceae bacterium]